MTLYALIFIAFLLVVAGVQFFYLAHLERYNNRQKRKIRELESQSDSLLIRIREAEFQITKLQLLLDSAESVRNNEVWADVISDQ